MYFVEKYSFACHISFGYVYNEHNNCRQLPSVIRLLIPIIFIVVGIGRNIILAERVGWNCQWEYLLNVFSIIVFLCASMRYNLKTRSISVTFLNTGQLKFLLLVRGLFSYCNNVCCFACLLQCFLLVPCHVLWNKLSELPGSTITPVLNDVWRNVNINVYVSFIYNYVYNYVLSQVKNTIK